MALEPYEKETIILWNDEEDTADIQVYRGALKTQLSRLASKKNSECKKLSENKRDGSAEFTIPKEWVKIVPVLTAKQVIE